MAAIIRQNQKVPEAFAAMLRAMAAEAPATGGFGRADASDRLNSVLMAACMQGWTTRALADVIGVSFQRVQQRVAIARVRNDIPDVPPPPCRPSRTPKPPKPRLLVKPEVADQLREMHAIARTVTGGTPADSPKRRISVEFTALIHSLVEQGVTMNQIAKELGVTHLAVRSRLARHGYRIAPPSMEGIAYRGVQVQQVYSRRESCKRGHPLSGDNLYVTPQGARFCRECGHIRGREYRARKRAKKVGA